MTRNTAANCSAARHGSKAAWIVLAGLLIALPARAQEDPAAQSARLFVQRLVDWYAPLRQASPPRPVSTARLNSYLSPDLARALAVDRAAQARVKDDVVGLDFDPVLGTQDPGDPGDRFIARQAHHKGARMLVDVAFVAAQATQPLEAQVEVVLEPDGHGWRIANFLYPPMHTDLLRVLAQLRQERKQDSHSGR